MSKDALKSCLQIVCQVLHKAYSDSKLQLDVTQKNNRLLPDDFIASAHALGLEAKILKVPFQRLYKCQTPLVLILESNQAVVITNFDKNKVPELCYPEGTKKDVKAEALRDHYTGYCIEVDHQTTFDSRGTRFLTKLKTSWFFSIIPQFKQMYFSIFLATLLSNIFVFVIPLFIMYVYDRVVPNEAMVTLWSFFIGATIFFLFDFVSRIFRGYLLDLAGYRTDQLLGHKLLKQTLNLKMIHKPIAIGSFVNNFREIQSIRDFFSSSLVLGFVDMPFIVLYLVGIWFLGGPIVFVPLVAVVLSLVVSVALEVPAKKNMLDSVSESNQKQGILIEAVLGLETLKSMCGERKVIKDWANTEKAASKHLTSGRYLNNVAVNITWFLYQMANISVVTAGVYLIHSGSMTVGALVAVTILTGRTMMVSQVATLLFKLQRTKESFKTMDRIMHTPGDRSEDKTYFHNQNINGALNFSKIRFRYPEQMYDTLDNIDFKVAPGEHVGVVGRNGSGKSTLLKTAVNLYTPSHGQVMLDELDVAELDPTVLRQAVHFMSDNPVLFYGSLKENITISNPLATDEQIQDAVKLSTVFKFVNNHALGYDMPVGERGELLSAGQKQAVALARAILADAKVYLLDEPTASIDIASEEMFATYFKEFIVDKTVLLVSHRTPLLSLMDRIIVLEKGQVVADAPSAEIIAKMNMEK